jgi:hypothetical protein
MASSNLFSWYSVKYFSLNTINKSKFRFWVNMAKLIWLTSLIIICLDASACASQLNTIIICMDELVWNSSIKSISITESTS